MFSRSALFADRASAQSKCLPELVEGTCCSSGRSVACRGPAGPTSQSPPFQRWVCCTKLRVPEPASAGEGRHFSCGAASRCSAWALARAKPALFTQAAERRRLLRVLSLFIPRWPPGRKKQKRSVSIRANPRLKSSRIGKPPRIFYSICVFRLTLLRAFATLIGWGFLPTRHTASPPISRRLVELTGS